jgi:putative intracellular protease/amidase
MKKIITIVSLFLCVFTSTVSNAEGVISNPEKILIVLTSHTELGNTGKKTGFWLPELTHPYYEFTRAGYSVDVASIDGGSAPVDSKAFEEEDSLGTTEVVPFLLQDKLVERGAIHVYGNAWEENVVVDNRLISGQNPASAKKVAQKIITLLEK